MEKTLFELGCSDYSPAGELFRSVPGTNDRYWISNLGRLITTGYRGGKKTTIMKPAKDANGYLRTMLLYGDRFRTIKIHRIVAQTWIDNPDQKEQVNHKNFNREDNSVSNLEWMTAKENTDYSYAAGRIKKPVCTNFVKGENIGTSKLTEKQVREIRVKFQKRVYTRQMLANEYGISPATVKDIVLKKSWKHLK